MFNRFNDLFFTPTTSRRWHPGKPDCCYSCKPPDDWHRLAQHHFIQAVAPRSIPCEASRKEKRRFECGVDNQVQYRDPRIPRADCNEHKSELGRSGRCKQPFGVVLQNPGDATRQSSDQPD